MSTSDWGRAGKRSEPFTFRVVCNGCGVEMSSPALPAVCPCCDGGELYEAPARPVLRLVPAPVQEALL